MILKTYSNKNLYGNYFLATETPDSEVTENQQKPKRNVKVITVKPSNRGKDYTVVGDPLSEPENIEQTGDVSTDSTDYDKEPDASETTADTESYDTTNNTDDMTADDGSDIDYTQTGEADNTDDDTSVDAPDTDGDEDFAPSSNEESDSSNNTDTTPDTNTSTVNKINAPGVELDSTRKYNLYKEFMSLYNACDNYIAKLENILRNDYDENQIIRIVVNNLREIKDIVADYMTIRFQINTYVQSLLFYQKMIVAVQLVFNLLKSINMKK